MSRAGQPAPGAAPKIDFLVAGVQKGGTTALFDYLQPHPELGLPPGKEMHIFDDEALDWGAPDPATVLARSLAPFTPFADRRLRGEATPIYAYWPQSLERIAAYNPAMRLVFLFRDPVARAWSHWRMERARGFDDAPFGWAIRQGRERVRDAPGGVHRIYSYVERGFYDGQLARIEALFPQSQVLLLRSEDLDDAPEATLARVHRFLGVEARPPAARLRSNVGAAAAGGHALAPEDAEHLRGLYAADLAAFARRSGLDVSGWMR